MTVRTGGRRVRPDLIVAIVQFASFFGDVRRGVIEHCRLIAEAADRGAALVLFPQLSLTGYEPEIIDLHSMRVDPDDGTLEPLAAVCRDRKVHALVGAPVCSPDPSGRPGTLPEIAVLHISDTGAIRVVYRKRHLDFGEIGLFAPGHVPGRLIIDGWRLALAVGRDVTDPSLVAEEVTAGADAYLLTGMYLLGAESRISDDLRSVAVRELWALLAQYSGATGGGPACGTSGAWAPGGREVLRLGGTPELGVVTLTTSR